MPISGSRFSTAVVLTVRDYRLAARKKRVTVRPDPEKVW
jgi:hypothetical protein